MDDTLRSHFIAAVLCLAIVGPAHADLTYISPAVTTRLEHDFNEAKPADAAGVLARAAWTCDMYGVRSKMQVERDLPLYRFHRGSDAAEPLVNDGDQPIVNYASRGDALAGADAQRGLRDELRLTKDGHLVGKLSLPAQKLTIAYAVCTGS